MIRIEHLSKYFGEIKAVDDVSFEVAEGENLVLLGTSGCGKTTTLKMINRLIEPTSGSIFINDQDIMDQQPEALRLGIGYVLQNTGLFPHYTIEENIAIVPKLLGWDDTRVKDRAAQLISKLHLDASLLKAYPAQLSGGQQQRVGLARALMADPSVLLMDEPFGALDNVTRAGIRKEFLQLDELTRKTIIMVTHDVQEAFELGDRICLMDKGRVVQIGTPKELLFNPANEFVSAFLQSDRLQLELKAVTLNDIKKHLPDGQKTTKENGNNDQSIWSVMEKLHGDQQRSAELSQLMTAFNQYQTKGTA